MSKLDSLQDGDWLPASYPGTYARERTRGPERLSIACGGGRAALVHALAAELRAPYKLLWVLHTPRGGSLAGRYESPALDGPDVTALFREFGAFWSEDARHDVWLFSRPDEALLVWDRHDLIYAYGPLDRIERALVEHGLRAGTAVQPPSPHAHNYHAAWDHAERELVRRLPWRRTPLQPADEQ